MHAIDDEHLPPILTDAKWEQTFELYGADEDDPLTIADGSAFSLVLAPKGRRQPAAGLVYEVAGASFAFAGNVATLSVAKAVVEDWEPGEYLVELRDVTTSANPDPLYVGQVWIARGLSHLASLGGGATWPGGASPGVQIVREAVRVIRGEAAGSAASAAASAEAAEADRLATAADRVATGEDRVATGQDRTATGQDRAAVETIAAQVGNLADAVADAQQSAAGANASQLAAAESETNASLSEDAALSSEQAAENALATLLGSAINAGGFLDLTGEEVAATTYTVTDADNGKLLAFTAATRVIVYVDNLTAGFRCGVMKAGLGDVEVWPGAAGAEAPAALLTLTTRYQLAALRQIYGGLHVLQGGEAELPNLGINRFLFHHGEASGLLYTGVI